MAGRLLVAAPVLTDPNFSRTVVLMLSHDASGALGLVLNRVEHEPPSPPLEPWVAYGPPPRSLFTGGPVQPDGLIGLISVPTLIAEAADLSDLVTPFITLGDQTVGTVDLAVGVDSLAERGVHRARLRVYRGYSGWGPGQLDHELRRPGWLPVRARAEDAFVAEPSALWRAVLARQRGTAAWLATFPDDLSAN
jgi:putative transcriptional regulator